ncbi:hypothetical protein OU994_06190 [Pseudoduganella sp. SL102]|uniref:hypothetical protein n=1 Tax=Pseudoduganella sp. SL102 TaxID=2995154 RepID=UPI00248B95C8|nr:hypothetical protein [Pseudoduganella sp. SL102]WBS03875.1 hypothetical protein OU994_06190 [Pseudoduganella sp. SL102]
MVNHHPGTFDVARTTWLRLTSRHRKALRDIPPELYEHWARTAHFEFNGIPRHPFFYLRAANALLDFFECVRRSNRPCALPSKAADSVWHAWLSYSPASLDAFCERHFGQRIPHVEAVDMSGGMALPIAMTLVTARTLDGLDLAGPRVPRLFATDRALGMPQGHAWQVQGSRMVLSHMDPHGRTSQRTRVHPATEPDFLLAAGLIAQGEYDRWLHACSTASNGGTAGSGVDFDLACDFGSGDSGGSDSGGSDGSGCGSSCGGGCGGGD